MITLKYYNEFLNEDEEANSIEASKPTPFKYEEDDSSYNFEYLGEDEKPYKLKIIPKLDLLFLTYPDLGFTWCGFSAIRKNQDYFRQFENGDVYSWLLKSVMIVKLKTHSKIDSETLESPNDTEQD